MVKLFEYFGITRDSALFLWTKIASLAILVLTGAIDPVSLGLNDRQKHALMITCGIIAYLSGQYSTSQLEGKKP